MEKKLLSIKETAEKLGIDPATVRRRIKKGELTAEMIDGAYGKQYMLDINQFETTAEAYTDVATLTRQVNVADLVQMLRNQIQEDVKAEIAAGNERLIKVIEEQNQLIYELTEELHKSQKQSIWNKIFKEK